jgi:hypothetical protein
MDPINYLAMVPQQDFLRDIAGGFQLGAGIGEAQQQAEARQLALQQKQVAIQRAQQYQTDLGAAFAAPSDQQPQLFMKLAMANPEHYEPITKSFASLSADQQRNELRDTYSIASTLQSGRSDLALQQIDDRIAAHKNSGQPTADLEALRTQVEQDPKAAYGQVLHIVSGLPGGDNVLKSLQGVNKDARDQAESDVTVAGKQADNVQKNLGIVAQQAGALAKPGVKPAQAITMFKTLEARGVIPKGGAQDYIDGIPADPKALPDYLKQVQSSGMKPDDQMKFTTPDANTVANNDRIAREGAANRANQVKVTQMVSDREGSKSGDVDQKQVENVAQLIASGRMAPLGAMAMRTAYGQAVMSRVAEINPTYRAQDFGTSSKAEKDFATGKLGSSVRSFNVGLAHLDTLGQLAEAMGNKDTQAINRLGNYFATQTGAEAPVKFEAAKKVVTDEIVKAIVGAGGTGHDREEAAKTVSAANSPAQLRGVINTYKELMVGQLGGLDQQYRTTTGRDDFHKYLSPQAQALYGKHGGAPAPTAAPALPAGWSVKEH